MVQPVTVVVPIWKSDLSHNEIISLTQCLRVLQNHDFSIITYRELNIEPVLALFNDLKISYKIHYFRRDYFADIAGYNRLMLSPFFYARFRDYRYLLIHQLDCFVFRDELRFWVDKNYSYIGAPWIKGYERGDHNAPIAGVGNGGFSLRNVADHLRTLLKFSYLEQPGQLVKTMRGGEKGTCLGRILLLLSKLTVKNNTFFMFNDFARWDVWEDAFWGRYASRFCWFSVPDYEIAAKFSVELQPTRFINGSHNLPFGCHAWWSYDVDFWRPHIERFGHRITVGRA